MNYVQKFLSCVVASALLSATIVLNRRHIFRFLNAPQRAQAIASLQKEYAIELENIKQRAKKLAASFIESQRDYFQQLAEEQKLGEVVENGFSPEMLIITAQNVVRLELGRHATRRYANRLSAFDAKLAAQQDDLVREQLNNREEEFVRMREAKFPVDALIERLWPTNPLKA